MLTLWDIIRPRRKSAPKRRERQGRAAGPAKVSAAQARYDEVTREMLAQYQVRVRKWRTSMTGMAWEVHYRDGTIARLIEAPRPKGPMSAAVFLHEIGHHAIGFHRYRPRCLEEYHAWAWALAAMERAELNVTDSVRLRMHESLHYAIAKARRRGLRELPMELAPFVGRPPSRRRRVAGDQPGGWHGI